MASRSIKAIILAALTVTYPLAQEPHLSSSSAQIAPRVKISFPSGISLEEVWLEYGLFGPTGDGRVYIGLSGSEFWSPIVHPFDPIGGQGHIVVPESFNRYYEIVALEDGQPVDHIKAVAWTRGCQIVKFDAAVGKTDIVLPFTCVPQGSVSLAGRIQEVALGGTSDTLMVGYHSDLSSTFFCKRTWCNISGPGLQIPEVAKATVTPDRSFELEVPDFAEDPFISGDPTAEFELYLTNSHITLEPDEEDLQSIRNSLKIAPSYPSKMVLVRNGPVPKYWFECKKGASPPRCGVTVNGGLSTNPHP